MSTTKSLAPYFPVKKVYVHTHPIHMATSHAGLMETALSKRIKLTKGEVLLFVNAKMDRIKILLYDGTGYVILYKRLFNGEFELPTGTTITLTQLRNVINNVKKLGSN